MFIFRANSSFACIIISCEKFLWYQSSSFIEYFSSVCFGEYITNEKEWNEMLLPHKISFSHVKYFCCLQNKFFDCIRCFFDNMQTCIRNRCKYFYVYIIWGNIHRMVNCKLGKNWRLKFFVLYHYSLSCVCSIWSPIRDWIHANSWHICMVGISSWVSVKKIPIGTKKLPKGIIFAIA